MLLLDAYGFGHPRASSGDDTRILRSSHGDDAFYARWAREARAVWEAFGQEQRVELFVQAGTLWFARRESGFEADSEATLRGLDIPVEHLSTDEVVHRWPGIRVDDLAWALFEPQGGLLLARRGVETVARAARRAGVDLRIGGGAPARIPCRGSTGVDQPARRLADHRRGVRLRVRTLAAGALPGHDRRPDPRDEAERALPGTGARRRALDGAALPDLGRLRDDLLRDRRGRHDRRQGRDQIPTARRSTPPGPPTGSSIPRPCRRSVTIAASGSLTWPRRRSSRRASASTRRPKTAHFLIDRHPSLDDVWLVGGGSGHGFKHGPVIGRYVADLLDGHEPTDEERRFSWTRDRSALTHLRTSAELV